MIELAQYALRLGLEMDIRKIGIYTQKLVSFNFMLVTQIGCLDQ